MRRAGALALLVTGAAPAAAATAAAFAGLPNLRFAYRDIEGDTLESLSASLEASAGHPPQGGSSYADTRWNIDWAWQAAGRGRACRIRSATVTFSALVTLPRLADRPALDPELRVRWDRFIAATERHEAHHARMAWEAVPSVRRAVLAGGCGGARAAARAAVRAIDRDQQAYDDRTRYGASEGARFP